MSPLLDDLDHRLLDLLKVNARLPAIKLAQALGCSRATVRARLRALERDGVITGYTISVARPTPRRSIRALLMVAVDSKSEEAVTRALGRFHEISRLYSVSGRFDLCALLATESTEELDRLLDRVRALRGVLDTFSTVILSIRLARPEE